MRRQDAAVAMHERELRARHLAIACGAAVMSITAPPEVSSTACRVPGSSSFTVAKAARLASTGGGGSVAAVA